MHRRRVRHSHHSADLGKSRRRNLGIELAFSSLIHCEFMSHQSGLNQECSLCCTHNSEMPCLELHRIRVGQYPGKKFSTSSRTTNSSMLLSCSHSRMAISLPRCGLPVEPAYQREIGLNNSPISSSLRKIRQELLTTTATSVCSFSNSASNGKCTKVSGQPSLISAGVRGGRAPAMAHGG